MINLTDRLEERAASYEQSGPSAHHTAAMLREAKFEIERLRSQLVKTTELADEALHLAAYMDKELWNETTEGKLGSYVSDADLVELRKRRAALSLPDETSK